MQTRSIDYEAAADDSAPRPKDDTTTQPLLLTVLGTNPQRDEDARLGARLGARLERVEDGADGKIVLELLECLLDFGELHGVAP